MKKIVKRIIAFTLTLMLMISCFAGCSSKGKTLMQIEDTEISVNMFMLYLSRLKGILCSSYSFGEDAVEDRFWDTVMSAEGKTYNEYYTESILENTKTYLAALYECDLKNIELPQKTLEKIDARIDEFIEYDAGGSKTTFNSMLAPYGVNYKLLREAYIIEEKIALLKDTVYGVNGELIGKNLIDNYYEQNYRRFKQIFFSTYDFVYFTDANGDDIYYLKDGHIAYDTNATPKTDSDGQAVYDEKGDRIYINVDDKGISRIAYDKTNGTRRHKTNEDGKNIIAKLEGERLQAVLDNVAQVMEKTSKNDFSGFEALMSKDETYSNGYYMTASTNYDSPEVVEALFEMEVGEVRMIPSDTGYGVYIIMRYDLEESGYTKKENSDFFISTTTGNYVFMSDIKNQLMSSYLEKHKDKIIIDEAVLAGVDMKSVAPNYYY